MFNYLVENQSASCHSGYRWWQFFRAPHFDAAFDYSYERAIEGKLNDPKFMKKYADGFSADQYNKLKDLSHEEYRSGRYFKNDPKSEEVRKNFYEYRRDLTDKVLKSFGGERKFMKYMNDELKSNFKFDAKKAADAIEDHYQHMRKSTLEKYRK